MGSSMNLEILKLLNPKSARLDGACGGVPAITIDDINYACAGTKQLGLDLLLAKVCGDRSAQNQAFYGLYQAVIQLAVDNKWKIRRNGKEKIRALTQLIIFELTALPRCPICHGTKHDKQLKPCRTCRGTGVYRITESQRAKALGIAPSTWQRVWAFRYTEVMSLATIYETDALRIIGKKFKRCLI